VVAAPYPLRLCVELKGEGTAHPAVDLLEASGLAPDRYRFSSFKHERVREALAYSKHAHPGSAYTSKHFTLELLEEARKDGMGLDLSVSDLSDEDAHIMSASGLPFMVYFSGRIEETEANLRHAVNMRPDMICTNAPHQLKELLVVLAEEDSEYQQY